MDLWLILFIFDWMLFVIIAGTVLYMGIFAVAALFHSKPEIPKAKKMNRFVILIPAYKQDNVIEQTVLSVLSQAYPQRMFDVTVISDHQEEITNMRLAQYPITLLTPDFEESTKAKSLQYAILNLPEFKIYDAVIILDGDNIIDQDFLDQVNDAFEIAATKARPTVFPRTEIRQQLAWMPFLRKSTMRSSVEGISVVVYQQRWLVLEPSSTSIGIRPM